MAAVHGAIASFATFKHLNSPLQEDASKGLLCYCRQQLRVRSQSRSRLLIKTNSDHIGRKFRQLKCSAKQETSESSLVANSRIDGEKGNTIAIKGSNGSTANEDLDCVLTGTDVECLVAETDSGLPWKPAELKQPLVAAPDEEASLVATVLDTLLLVSPFFFWGTAMVAMKDVLPKAGPLFVAAVRLIPAGALLVAFAASRNRKMPSTGMAWLAITVFALVDGTCFQGCLAEGLRRTSAGLGSVIIDSQPLTVAVLAAVLFGESIGPLGALGLVTGVLGLCLLEIPLESLQTLLSPGGVAHLSQQFTSAAEASSAAEGLEVASSFSLWDSGEWWMLLSAQSMAVGTVLVRWVCRYSDPIMATGWHMIIGGVPLLLLSAQQHDPALNGQLGDLDLGDWTSLLYTSLFGSAVSYGVFFYNANKGNLTRLSSLTFLTPMFAALFGYIFLGETFSEWQLVGAAVTLVAIVLVNAKPADSKDSEG